MAKPQFRKCVTLVGPKWVGSMFSRTAGTAGNDRTTSIYGFGAQLIGLIQLHVKRQNSSICKFFQDIAWTFCLPVSGKICHSPIKKVKRQPTLIISFSQHSPFFEEQSKNAGWNPTGVIRYLGSVSGSLWQNSPHKDAFFCISLTNIDQCWITCTFKVE